MFDFDLSELYDVETRTLKQAVRRNKHRFPNDFLIQLSKEEWKKHITTCDNLPENVKYSPVPPFAFSEQGVAMISSVLRSEKLNKLESKYNMKFKDIDTEINFLLQKDKLDTEHRNRNQIGFKQNDQKNK